MARDGFSPAKGTRDWYGKETIIRNYIRDTLREVFESYGYDRLETAPIENQASLGFKGGGEIQKEVFALNDQGGRKLALRFDQTVPLARYVASNQVTLPFKRYAIGEVFRDGPTQPEQGRYRVFTQCDVDILGVKSMSAEGELFYLAQDAFSKLGLGNVEININNRKLLEGILDYAGVPVEARVSTILTLDKMDKIRMDGVRRELMDLTLFNAEKRFSDESFSSLTMGIREKGINYLSSQEGRKILLGEVGEYGYDKIIGETIEMGEGESIAYLGNFSTKGQKVLTSENVAKILDSITPRSSNKKTISFLESIVNSPQGIEGLEEVSELLEFRKNTSLDIRFNPTLARGLDYYTGTTIEVYLSDRNVVSSAILAGGRFDDMVGDFKGSEEEIPAVGFSFGLERLSMIMANQREFLQTSRKVYLIPIGVDSANAIEIAHQMRQQGVNVDVELRRDIRVKKSTRYADNSKIPFMAYLGEDELASDSVTIKDMNSGKQEKVPVVEVKKFLSRK